MSTCLFGATSTRTAVGDAFLSIVNNLAYNPEIVVIKGKEGIYDNSEFNLDNSRILELNFNKNNSFSYFDLKEWIKIVTFLKRNKVKHIFFYSTAPINIFVVSLFRKCSFSIWCHDPIPHPGESLRHIIPKEIDLRLMISNSRCSNVFVASSFLNELLVSRKGVRSNKVSSLNLPYMEEIVRYRPETLPVTTKNDIIFWGRIEPYKGLSVLSQALVLLREWGVEFSAVIIGNGPIDKFISPSLLNDQHINIKNRYVTNQELAEDICSSKIAVFPYTSATGTQTIQTALTLGCKVVASDVGNFGELLKPTGKNFSRLVPPNDPESLAHALQDLLKDETLSNYSGANVLELYSPKRWAETILKTIKGE